MNQLVKNQTHCAKLTGSGGPYQFHRFGFPLQILWPVWTFMLWIVGDELYDGTLCALCQIRKQSPSQFPQMAFHFSRSCDQCELPCYETSTLKNPQAKAAPIPRNSFPLQISRPPLQIGTVKNRTIKKHIRNCFVSGSPTHLLLEATWLSHTQKHRSFHSSSNFLTKDHCKNVIINIAQFLKRDVNQKLTLTSF